MDQTDENTTFGELKSKIKAFNHARNWEQFHSPKEVAISISIESAELLEIFQWQSLSTSDIKKDEQKITEIKEEIADIMIYIFGLANTLHIDLSQALLTKLEKNAEKYPVKS
jgi:NTP pyrophosphatase (non-canonical NTP hydrolase)